MRSIAVNILLGFATLLVGAFVLCAVAVMIVPAAILGTIDVVTNPSLPDHDRERAEYYHRYL